METLTEDKVDYAQHIVSVLNDLHTHALNSYIKNDDKGLAWLYGAVPIPDLAALNGALNDVTQDFLTYGPLAVFWTDLVHATVQSGITDAMQIVGKPARSTVARKRHAYVLTSQTFWLSYWNTYKVA